MASARQFVIDTWAALSYKRAFQHQMAPSVQLAPGWVTGAHKRRLTAYTVLAGTIENSSRFFLSDDAAAQATYREYGDAELIVQTYRAAVLGGVPTVQVEGADGDMPREPTQEDVVDGGPQLPELLAEWEQERTAQEAAVARQEWFARQFESEKAAQKIVGCEDNVVGLGDGVYWLTWDGAKQRVRLRHVNPGFYFPVFADTDDEFPNKVHLAWEYEDDSDVKWVRRITHERVRLPQGQSKRYPYAPDEASEWTVQVTDAKWRWDDLGDRNVNDFDMAKASVTVNTAGVPLEAYDLGIDFIPVVHVPNTVSTDTSDPWGKSALLRIMQILDDLARNDTDTALTARLVASPPLTHPVDAPIGNLQSYGPGSIIPGNVTLLDTSKSLDALLKMGAELQSRLAVNRQIPASILGRTDQGDIKSGVHLLLTFGPFTNLIEDARLVRSDKYDLLCKMWQRLAIVGQDPTLEGDTQVFSASLAFGPYLPSDVNQTVDVTTKLLSAHAISRGTSARMLQEAGVPIESIEDELDQVKAEDADTADKIASALASEAAAAEYLGITPEHLAELRAQASGTPSPAPPPPLVPPDAAGAPSQQEPPA